MQLKNTTYAINRFQNKFLCRGPHPNTEQTELVTGYYVLESARITITKQD